ncbi:uncharacterized protein LOC126428447 isoform X2 [Schistocerca serialis cubense]|uniref:uncharacterized protein LOC126428447 isoform X2 n=1 Tax=Schistocerca serialis cubense TaxID=2023355 RepID=UPI00214E9394|nr:uncharacterized protein LOC126428447 isoform X2 [Schistocerca serialis cubense]
MDICDVLRINLKQQAALLPLDSTIRADQEKPYSQQNSIFINVHATPSLYWRIGALLAHDNKVATEQFITALRHKHNQGVAGTSPRPAHEDRVQSPARGYPVQPVGGQRTGGAAGAAAAAAAGRAGRGGLRGARCVWGGRSGLRSGRPGARQVQLRGAQHSIQGRYYKRSDGLALGPGPFVKGLEYATNVKPEVVGKPTELFFRTALGGVPADEAVMIGDDVRDDIDGAQQVGIRGYLVQTGKYRPGDKTTINPPPHSVVPSFAEAVEKILAEAAAS